jgi:hypothetical protein
MNQLDFESHRREKKTLMGPCPSTETAEYFARRAEEAHSYAVYGALTDARLAIQGIETILSSDRAKDFIRYGVGRRLEMIWISYREILDLVATDRQEPLPQDDVSAVGRDLNVIYVNIMGVLDNYAWCLLYEATTDQTKKLKRGKVGLFSPAFMTDSNLAALRPRLNEQNEWHQELKTRRDPAAHRFPLYVPPCGINSEQQIRYQELCDQFLIARNGLDFEQCDQLRRQREKIGTFVACFIHDFREPPIPIYPTVPQDIANLIKIGEHVRTFLNERVRTR